MKFDIIVADPPWTFGDKLTMSNVPRGAAANYDELSMDALKKLKVDELTNDAAVLALWTPSSFLREGLDLMSAWGFEQKQTWIWVKTKKKENIFKELKKEIKKTLKESFDDRSWKDGEAFKDMVKSLDLLDTFDLNKSLNFYMGHLFRNTHELALIGKKGSIYSTLENKSQRSVLLHGNPKHSEKPEGLQDKLEIMFPKANNLELFARRDRKNWTCVGDECPSTTGEDIRKSIKNLLN